MVHFNADVVAAAAAALNFTQVALTPPLDWVAGNSLFPSQVIAGYNAPLDEYTAAEWSAHILEECKGFPACTSAGGFQGMISISYTEALVDPPTFAQADTQYQQQTVAARVGDFGLGTSIGAVLRMSHSTFAVRG